MKQIEALEIQKYLDDDYIMNGFKIPFEIDYIQERDYICYDFGSGFACFVEIKPNAYFVACGFFKGTQGIFKKCKLALKEFLKYRKDAKIYSTVHKDNLLARYFNNSFGLKFQRKLKHNLRLYKYIGGANG